MLTNRKEQLAVFGPLGKKAFEDRILAHFKKVFPEQSEALGEPKLRETIQYGTQRVATYRIISERDVCKYIESYGSLWSRLRQRPQPSQGPIHSPESSPKESFFKNRALVQSSKKNKMIPKEPAEATADRYFLKQDPKPARIRQKSSYFRGIARF